MEAKDAAAEAFAKELTTINKEVKAKALQKDPELAKDLKTVETAQQKAKEIRGKQTQLEERKQKRLSSAERREEGIKAFEAGEFDRF